MSPPARRARLLRPAAPRPWAERLPSHWHSSFGTSAGRNNRFGDARHLDAALEESVDTQCYNGGVTVTVDGQGTSTIIFHYM
ncbi:uncharacterized protein LOC127473219 isoform X2 [Manacus candei]|uniref:uncharacterized protein LOC127473219 isoform X2 n=1 Tax=Manacus candei TaxID=415023 RepID=UPI002227CEBA|nr:uncharacterized protein LOC127473219 isoform X2 [Manacus candei]